MKVTYTTGPRYIDGVNIDADVDASMPTRVQERAIDEPVTGLAGALQISSIITVA